jgi:uncharacterized protein YdaU (DUF1376 family)
MGKQPYIPFYVGDYLKDTRILPLAVRGAWVDLILYMWDAPVRGELIGTIEDFARLMSCERSEAQFALDLLKQKMTADFVLLDSGQIKIVSRKMKRDDEISKIRSGVGKKGVEAKKKKEFASAKDKANGKQNPEYDNEDEIKDKLKGAFDEIYLDQQKIKWPHLDFMFEYRAFCEKVRGSPDHYRKHDSGGLRLAFQSQLRNSKGKNGNGNTKNNGSGYVNGLMEGFKQRNSVPPEGGEV